MTPIPRPPRRLLRKVWTGAAVLIVPALIAGFVAWPRSPLDLGEAGNMVNARVRQHWAAGDVIVLIRHAERCDRSDDQCLDVTDGITHDGSQAADRIGDGFRALGMANTDVISSPTTRTAQTGHYMFGEANQAQEWLRACSKTHLLEDALAHKQAHRNLILITHSDCISKLQAQLGYEHADASDYGTAFFVRVHHHDKARALGVLAVGGWDTALKDEAR